jgi:hypothetical protein
LESHAPQSCYFHLSHRLDREASGLMSQLFSKAKPHRPSPLAQVQHRPLSTQPEDMAVRDPMFWKRFSRAVHAAEVDEEKFDGMVSPTSSSSGSMTKATEDR